MKTVIDMALHTGFDADDETTLTSLERFAELVRAVEREACAKVADSWNKNVVWENKMLAVNIAKEIRARGETK